MNILGKIFKFDMSGQYTKHKNFHEFWLMMQWDSYIFWREIRDIGYKYLMDDMKKMFKECK